MTKKKKILAKNLHGFSNVRFDSGRGQNCCLSMRHPENNNFTQFHPTEGSGDVEFLPNTTGKV